jgi:hypothetical protein|tara:strand:+ start:1628 stop:2134 length:507 start_codon:yes stop_codon:yes gene_type:complete
MKIISNCSLCEERSLHVIGEGEIQTQQCINCGYVTSEKLTLNGKSLEEHTEYLKLTDDMKSWLVVKNDRIWLPTLMILPIGMLHPDNIDKKMKWCFSPMTDIPEEEQKNFPREDGNGFHTRRMDTDNPKIYDTFLFAISEVNRRMKEDVSTESTGESKKIKLPKIKKK